jgi:hypothetical protein
MVSYLVIAILVALVGCAPKPILMDQQAKESLSAIQEIKVVYYRSPTLLVPPTAAPVPLFAYAIADSADRTHRERLGKSSGVDDPILKVKDGFLPSMQTSLPKAILSEISHPLPNDDMEDLKKELGQGFLLDFKTTRWGIINNMWQVYSYVVYQGRARLVDISGEKILWQGVCDLEEKDLTTRPSIHDFEADNGTLFKEYLAKLATSCVKELNKQFVGSSAPK